MGALALSSIDLSMIFIELGLVVVGLALLSRLASKWGFSSIPLYLIAGLAFGNGGLIDLKFGQEFVHVGGEVGVILLLFTLGLEYSGAELRRSLRKGAVAGGFDLLVNFAPGFISGLLLGWGGVAATVLGGVTAISSSGVIAKVLSELKWKDNPETPAVVTILVIEDLAMAVYLPIVGVLVTGQGPATAIKSVSIALLAVGAVLFIALRHGRRVSRLVSHESDEVVLLTALGLVLLVSGLAQKLQVSAAVGAFLVGVAVSGPIAHRAERLIAPLRDLFAAIFFLFFGLQIDPSTLGPVLPVALLLGAASIGTKLASGWFAATRAKLDRAARWRAGAALVARGEFSIVIAGLAAATEPRLGPLSAAYVLLLAIAGPLLCRMMVIWQRGKSASSGAA